MVEVPRLSCNSTSARRYWKWHFVGTWRQWGWRRRWLSPENNNDNDDNEDHLVWEDDDIRKFSYYNTDKDSNEDKI